MLERLERWGKGFEDALLLLILTGMIGLAAGQIVLRNIFDTGFIWTDELLRMLVLWIAMAGALAASRRDRHISIAILDRYLPDWANRGVQVFIDAFTSAVCGIVCWHSLRFVIDSRLFGDTLFGGFPAWIAQAVVPVGFGLIAWRYAVLGVRGLLGRPRVKQQP
ncbi:MAG: TRAP transporter small permease [Xanthomonadales bacterium]|nr:TRAP transporter small permease [Xanthomonadales bacterium]